MNELIAQLVPELKAAIEAEGLGDVTFSAQVKEFEIGTALEQHVVIHWNAGAPLCSSGTRAEPLAEAFLLAGRDALAPFVAHCIAFVKKHRQEPAQA